MKKVLYAIALGGILVCGVTGCTFSNPPSPSPATGSRDAAANTSADVVPPDGATACAGPQESHVYRFDSRLKEAVRIEAPESTELAAGIHTLFPRPAGIEWTPSGGKATCEVRDGVLYFETGEADGLINTGDLGLFGPEIESIVLRLKVSGTDRLTLSWMASGIPWQFWAEDLKWFTPIYVEASDHVVEYRVRVSGLDPWRMRSIRQLRLATEGPARIEVHTIEAHTLDGTFARSPVGVHEYRIKNELRPCLFAHCPASIEYDVVVPRRGRFSAGLAVTEGAGPVVFTLTAEKEGRVEEKLRREVHPDSGWNDAQADLSAYGGERIRIALRVEGDPHAQVGLWSSPTLYQPRLPSTDSGAPSILLYIVDALRADHIDVYGHPRENAPRLRAFAREGVRFERCRSQESCTKPSMTSLAVGRDKTVHGFDCFRGISVYDGLTIFPELLRAAGYVTAVCSENPLTPPPAPDRCVYDHVLDFNQDHASIEGATHDAVVQLLERYRDRPLFLYVHTMECHGQVYPPPGAGFIPPEGMQPLWGKPRGTFSHESYDLSIAFADYNFGRVLDQLQALGLARSTAVIFTSDHGEGFWDHEGKTGHGHTPFEEQIWTPLLMRWPGVLPAGTVVPGNVQLIDLTPTLLEMADLPPCAQFRGLSLLECAQDPAKHPVPSRIIFSFSGWDDQMSAIDGSWKLLVRPERQETTLFNLAEDPRETRDVKASHPEVLAALQEALSAHCTQEHAERQRLADAQESHVQTVEPDKIEAIRAMGYLD